MLFTRLFRRAVIFSRVLLVAGLFAASADIHAQGLFERERAEAEEVTPVRLNNRNFQKNLEKYAHELDLTSKQVKKLNKIDRKFSRKEARLGRKPSTKRRDLKSLQKAKREQMIAVLTYEQQRKLEKLSRKNFWDFLRARN